MGLHLSFLFLLLIQSMSFLDMSDVVWYSPRDYQAHEHNYDLIQLENGKMAVANSSGVLLYNGNSWSLLPGLEETQTYTITEADGKLYYGGLNSFGYYQANENLTLVQIDLSDKLEGLISNPFDIRQIYSLPEGFLLKGSGFVFFYDGETVTNVTPNNCEEGECRRHKFSLFTYHSHTYLLCHEHDFFRWNGGESGDYFRRYELFQQIDSKIHHVFDSDDNRLLIITDNHIYTFKDGKLSQWDNELPRTGPAEIYPVYYRNGYYIINIQSHGIYKLNESGKLVSQLDQNNGLLNMPVTKISSDSSGQVWLSGQRGISRIETGIFRNSDVDIKPVISRVRLYDSDSLFYSVFSTEPLGEFSTRLNKLPNNLTIDSFLPDYYQPDRIFFQSKLEGFQDDWSEWRLNPKREFTNLKPGDYKYYIRSKLADGTITEAASVTFTIPYPWYNTIAAYLIYLLIIIVAIGVGIKKRIERTKKREQELEEIINKRTREIKKQKEQLSLQAEQLQYVNNQRTQFFNNISHELRTPLTLILGPLDKVMENEGNHTEEEMEALEVVYRNAQRLRSLTNQMLEITKLHKGQLKLKPVMSNLRSIILNVGQRFVYKVRQESKEFGYRLPEYDMQCLVDPEKMDVILSNLIGNAFKYTKSGDKIIITAGFQKSEKDDRSYVKVRVEDSGIGIPKDQQPFIFDYYYQVEMNELTYSEGTGIGLSYVKDLVELHGGSIEVESRLGMYSCFDILLPVGEEPVEPFFDQVLETPMQEFKINLPVLPDTHEQINRSPASGTILIVEDNVDLQKYLKLIFRNDYNVMLASNGKEALKLMKEQKPSLIISDVMMPEMDGWTFLEQIKHNDHYRTIPVIMLTALTESDDRLKGLRTGVDDYISKPFNKEELIIRVENLMKNYEERQREIGGSEDKSGEKEPKVESMHRSDYARILLCIKENLHNADFSSVDLAKKLNMSERSMYDKVKRSTGLTPVQLINQKRIEVAKKTLIEDKDKTIIEIALDTGFTSSTYFSRIFKKTVGTTPAQFRARHH